MQIDSEVDGPFLHMVEDLPACVVDLCRLEQVPARIDPLPLVDIPASVAESLEIFVRSPAKDELGTHRASPYVVVIQDQVGRADVGHVERILREASVACQARLELPPNSIGETDFGGLVLLGLNVHGRGLAWHNFED